MRIDVYKLNFCKVCLAAVFMMLSTGLLAADQATGSSSAPVRVTGTVKDATGAIVIGASIIEKGTTNGAVSNANGGFSITVKPNAKLQVAHLSYATLEVTVGNQKFLNIVLNNNEEKIDEIVVVGYGVQKKASLTGAVSAIKSEEIVTTKNENVQNMLTGKIPGLRVVQNSSEPGQFNASMDIRGFGAPLIVIDGVPRNNMARLDSEDIESISILKDGSASIYGVRAANGVVLITTKKGKKGAAVINYSGNMSWQIPSNFPELTGAVDWMTLFNERSMHNVDNPTRPYTDSQIDAYRKGELKSTDWRSEVFRESAPQTQHTMSASGGTDALSYYASVGYQYQGSFLQTDAMNYEKYTMRSNISSKISKNLKFDLNLAGFIDDRQSSVYGSSDIVRGMWTMQPMDKVFYNKEEGKYWQPSNAGLQNPVAMMNTDLTGENSYKSKWFQSSASLTYDIPGVKGLSVKGLYSYDFTMNENKEYLTGYQLYDSGGNPKSWNLQSDGPNKIGRYYYGKNASLWHAQIAYNNTFGKHNISAMAMFENSHNDGDNFSAIRQGVLPIDQIFAGLKEKQEGNQSSATSSLYDLANQALISRINYEYANKYLLEVAVRYEGSTKFIEDDQWNIFPSVSAGWRVSEEKFWKQSPLKFINNFKLRASYGEMGDDSAMNYQFLDGYVYPAGGTGKDKLPDGSIFDGKYVISNSNKGLANRDITWFKSKITNIGFDLDAWNGMLSVTGEYFRRNRTGLLTTRSGSLPGITGVALPQENLNSDLTQGFELEVSHRHQIGDFRYQVKGNVSFTRTKTIHYEQARRGNSYLNWRQNNDNRHNGVWWGYEGAGRITSWDDIYNNPTYIGRGSIMGDYEYKDWNGDGWINDLDVHPLATNGMVPLLYYGLTINAQWKGLDISMLWQGAGKRYVAPRQFLYQPLWADTNALTDFMDRWHPVDPTADPYNPATKWKSGDYAYTGSSPNVDSDFNVQNAAYLRLKNIEIGYTLPKRWLSTINIQSVRVYFSAYNLLTFTKLKHMDPEFFTNPDQSKGGYGDLGYNYPLNKTVTIGLNVKF